MRDDSASVDFDRAVQGHDGELIGEVADRIELMQIISQKLLYFGRQVVGAPLDRLALRHSSITHVSTETVDCINLVFRELAQECAYRDLASSDSAIPYHDLTEQVISGGQSIRAHTEIDDKAR